MTKLITIPRVLGQLLEHGDSPSFADRHRALAVDSASVEAHYELARMVLDQVLEAIVNARIRSGMGIGQTGPIRDAEMSSLLQTRYRTSLRRRSRKHDAHWRLKVRLNQV